MSDSTDYEANSRPVGEFSNDQLEILGVLRSFEVVLPEDNAQVQKDTHNATLENYCKYILETVGSIDVLNAHFAWMLDDNTILTDVQARDVFTLWAPLAEIVGQYEVKTRLEERAFAQCYPDEKAAIEDTYRHLGGDKELGSLMESYTEVLNAVLAEALQDLPVKVVVDGRTKSAYSVWRKVTGKNRSSYKLPDYFGLRAVLCIYPDAGADEAAAINACYAAADTLMQLFSPDLNDTKIMLRTPSQMGTRVFT